MCNLPFALGQTFLGAAPESMGDSGRAATDAIESHYLNPAALAFTKDYHMGGVFQEARIGLETPANNYAFVVTDNSPDKFAAAGLGYVYKRSSFVDRTYIDQDFSLSFAGKVLPTFSLGMQGHRLVRQVSGGGGFVKHNLTFGTLIVPSRFLGVAVVAYDMLADDDLDLVPVIALGVHVVVLDIIRLRADIARQEKRNPDRQGSLGLGLEIVGGYGFLVRTGGLWDNLNRQTFWSTGLGWEGPNLSLAYAYKTNINVAGDSTHTFQTWLNF